MVYQDKRLKGRAESKGYRECEERYSIIKDLSSQYTGSFTVCDIGSNMNYFGLRLTEDFHDCKVMAFEFDHFDMRMKQLIKNKAGRILFINRKITLHDLTLMKYFCHFEVILILSVLHHINNGYDQWISALRELGDNIIIEFAMQDSPRFKFAKECTIPDDGRILGLGSSHLSNDILRPIVHIPGSKTYEFKYQKQN